MSSDSASSAAPLLSPRQPPPRTSALSLLLSRVASTSQRRGGPSVMVRETAARELEERRADWGYSKPVVAIDILWNLAFVIVTVVMLICTAKEKPDVPIRVWVCGYVLQCMVHVVLVWAEYCRRSSRQERIRADPLSIEDQTQSDSDEDDANRGGLFCFCGYNGTSVVKRWESLNTVASFIWWIVGFYWVVSGGETLLISAPRLYWLAVVFLSFDVIFAIFCVVLALLIGIALCCCLPCIIAILYAIAGQEGASESDLSVLPKYRYEAFKDHRVNIAAGTMIPIETSSGCRGNIQNLAPEDTECCICLCTYEDGTELHSLPCDHHFHSTCIVKWLKMNATCPLCKYNILKGGNQV